MFAEGMGPCSCSDIFATVTSLLELHMLTVHKSRSSSKITTPGHIFSAALTRTGVYVGNNREMAIALIMLDFHIFMGDKSRLVDFKDPRKKSRCSSLR